MKPARQDPLSAGRQMALSLGPATLQGMSLAERREVTARLASLLLEAASAQAEESSDDRA
jgi:hypothetical protein